MLDTTLAAKHLQLFILGCILALVVLAGIDRAFAPASSDLMNKTLASSH
jgi:hypothetical protein